MADSQRADCECCLEPLEDRHVVLACLHAVCVRCARTIAEDAVSRCPACFEVLDAALLLRDAGCAEDARTLFPDVQQVPDGDPAAGDAARDRPPMLVGPAQELLARACVLLQEAQDLAAFAEANAQRVVADVAAFYACLSAPPEDAADADTDAAAYAARLDALLAEAGVRLAAERKAAALGVDAALGLWHASTALLGHGQAVQHGAVPDAHAARLQTRLRTLVARADAWAPSISSATYFAAVLPPTPRTEPHAHLARTLLWHERWGEAAYTPPQRVFPLGMTLACATPDGRVVLRPVDRSTWVLANAGVLHNGPPPDAQPAPPPRTATHQPSPGIVLVEPDRLLADPLERMQPDDRLLLAHSDADWFARPVVDGAGRIWHCGSFAVRCWAPDGRVLHDRPLQELTDLWGWARVSGDLAIWNFFVAPSGVLLVLLSVHADDCLLVALTPDLRLLWQHALPAARPSKAGQIVSISLAFDVLLLELRDAGCRALDVHTGALLSPAVGSAGAAFADRFTASHPTWVHVRAEALQRLWPPERVRALWPEAPAPKHPPVARVWRACDFPRMMPYRVQDVVLCPHGRVLFNVRNRTAVAC